jgi:P-type conjugative transfer protein TrbJ
MNRFIIAAIVATPLLLIKPTQSDAIIVECANCSDIIDQALSNAKQALQYETQLQQKALQLQQYENMLTNTASLPQSVWANVQNDVQQIRNIANAASLLTGNSGSILTRLQSAQGYAGQVSSLPQNMGQQFQMWQQTIGNASNSLGRTLGVQQGQEQSYTALQAAIQAHSSSAVGQMQVMQAGVEMSALTSAQLQQVQTTLLAAAQEQATRDLVAADRQMLNDAARQQFFQPIDLPFTGDKY